jgi:tRNA1Val (adenine37-N6)-methyltransferase
MNSILEQHTFYFKQFQIRQDRCPMKIGTDGVLLGAWADVSQASQILDIGTGTGVIAAMMAQRTQEATIHAVEIDAEAYGQAKENLEQTPWANRLSVYHQAVQEFAKEAVNQYDLLVSNPPFFTGGTFSHQAHRNQVRHTVKLPHGDLLSSVRRMMHPGGKFCVILPFIEGLRFQELAQSYHLYVSRITEVRPKATKPVERLLMQLECHPTPTVKDQLIIQHDGPNQWTEEYVQLTRDFYLNM